MGNKLYSLEELEAYFNEHGMEWYGYCFNIYCIHDKKSDEDKYILDDYNYAEKKSIKYDIEFDFTHNGEDAEGIDDMIRLFNEDEYNQEHFDPIKLDSSAVSAYVIETIKRYEVQLDE